MDVTSGMRPIFGGYPFQGWYTGYEICVGGIVDRFRGEDLMIERFEGSLGSATEKVIWDILF